MMTVVVEGSCSEGYSGVRDALRATLESGADVGASVSVMVDGETVVDVWGGHADAARTRPWQRDTIVNLYSVGKAISAICALRLVDAGVLAGSARTRAPSDTSAPGARSDSPIPTRASRSATR